MVRWESQGCVLIGLKLMTDVFCGGLCIIVAGRNDLH